jgi:hypothetical protein
MPIAIPAALDAQTEPAQEQPSPGPQPPTGETPSSEAPQANADEQDSPPADAQLQPEAEAPPSADVDSVRSATAAPWRDYDVPAWVYGRYCTGPNVMLVAEDHTFSYLVQDRRLGGGYWRYMGTSREAEPDGSTSDLVHMWMWSRPTDRNSRVAFRRRADGSVAFDVDDGRTAGPAKC